MFDSGLKASELIEQIKGEADISPDIPDALYVLWINELEQLLYTELIKEQGKIEVTDFSGHVIEIDSLATPAGENSIRFEDIYTVFADQTQLIKSTVTSGIIFPNTYYKISGSLGIQLENDPEVIKIIYFVKPELKTEDNIGALDIMLPLEFIDLVKAKLRGEAYKIANEDTLAAKWINDYNVLLETFKTWLSTKQPSFGM